jgi:hypothetical protein
MSQRGILHVLSMKHFDDMEMDTEAFSILLKKLDGLSDKQAKLWKHEQLATLPQIKYIHVLPILEQFVKNRLVANSSMTVIGMAPFGTYNTDKLEGTLDMVRLYASQHNHENCRRPFCSDLYIQVNADMESLFSRLDSPPRDSDSGLYLATLEREFLLTFVNMLSNPDKYKNEQYNLLLDDSPPRIPRHAPNASARRSDRRLSM